MLCFDGTALVRVLLPLVSLLDSGSESFSDQIPETETVRERLSGTKLAQNNGKTILLVDDEGSSLEMLQAALESWGYEVWLAADGEEALATYKVISPAAVVADVVMPNLDGLSLLRRLKETYPNTIVILCTAHASLQTAISAIKGGAADLLPKPIDFGRLKQLLDGLFGEGVSERKPAAGLSTPASSGTRPPETNLTMRGTRLQDNLPQCRDISSLSGGRLSAPGSVYQGRKSLIN
jgi:CheY-like chemotaxis protein